MTFDRDTLCSVCRQPLDNMDLLREGIEAVRHGAAVCSSCRACSACGEPRLTDELRYAGYTVCESCEEPVPA